VKTTYSVVKEGAGDAVVAKNSKVKVHATGTVIETEKKFWSTKDKGQQPFEYTAGVGGVIKGWDQGCLGMKIGEVRQLTIPADEGYGANGFPAWGIPPNGGLYFGARALCRGRFQIGHHSTYAPPAPDSQCADRRSVPRRNRGAADQVSELCMHGSPGALGKRAREPCDVRALVSHLSRARMRLIHTL
jgi:U3 small nucleolar RNA-associated protein 21